MSNKPIINTHTHIFTAKNIPPLIAKTFVPWPFYWLFHIGLVFSIFKLFKRLQRFLHPFWSTRNDVIAFIRSTPVIRWIDHLVSILLTVNVLLFILKLAGLLDSVDHLKNVLKWAESNFIGHLLFHNGSQMYQIFIAGVLLYLYPAIGKGLWAIATQILSPLKYLPSPKTLEFFQRYLTIAEFAKYKSQKGIYNRLIKMYEPGSKFVVLPMDMEYMKARKPQQSYLDQIGDIANYYLPQIDNEGKEFMYTNTEYLIPFLFVDPRRIDDKSKEKEKPFFNWDIEKRNNQNFVILKDCVVRDCFEGDTPGYLNGKFKGIKIYPALGYYPFDEKLLPLWVYCQQNNLPITTHCIEGTIFYRGKLEKKWMHHPVFKNKNGTKLKTKVKNNFELQINFTHPLNYLVLLEEVYLKDVVERGDKKLKQLFGFQKINGESFISQNLNELKINLAHYGGTSEWLRFLDADRENLAVELIENPLRGIELVKVQNPKPGEQIELWSKPAWIWNKNFEWFSIISSLMLQYKNVYADISYILHSEEVKPLLFQVLNDNKKLANKILYGTDFYVVRNHKSEKGLYSDLIACIGQQHMNLIARENPHRFLSNNETPPESESELLENN